MNFEEQRAKRNRNVLIMAIAYRLRSGTVLVSQKCYVIVNALFSGAGSKLPCETPLYMSIASFLARANCAINPSICFTFSGNFRDSLKRILKCFGAIWELHLRPLMALRIWINMKRDAPWECERRRVKLSFPATFAHKWERNLGTRKGPTLCSSCSDYTGRELLS